MIDITRMTSAHLDEIMRIEEDSFSLPWSRSSFEDELKNAMAIYFVALENGEIAGYAGMWHIVNEGHVTNIAVAPVKRRSGIGSRLMDALLAEAARLDMIGITLEVRIGNAPAMRLYGKYGFKAEGIRKNYYSDTKEDAVIMWLNL